MKTALLLIACMVLLFGCQQKPKEESAATPEGQAPAKDSFDPSQSFEMAVRRLPVLEPPFQFDYKYGAGVEMTTDSLLYKVLVGKTTKPEIKRVVGLVKNIDNASVEHIFWFGKQNGGTFWRAYVTTCGFLGGWTVIYSQELDAIQEDIERCDPKISDHWTAVNDHLESRSVINMTLKCTGGTESEIVRTLRMDVNEIVEEDYPHPFLNSPIKLPVAGEPEPIGDLNYYQENQLDYTAGSVFFQDRPTEFRLTRVRELPLEMDGRALFGVIRSNVWHKEIDRYEIQYAFVSGEKVDDLYRVGKGITYSIPMAKPGETGGSSPDFMVMHDHFLRLHGTLGSGFSNDEYTHWIVRQGYDLKYLEDLSYEMMRVERNYVFAKYGLIFKSSDLAQYFSQFPWYKPTSKNIDDQLTDDDKALIKRIKELEESSGRVIVN